jgi:RNA-directed DNA polymerase
MTCNLKWNEIHWKRAHLRLWKLQRKIYEHSLLGNKNLVMLYQNKLINSDSAKLIAVRKVTQEFSYRGKKTPGVDGVKEVSPTYRVLMANNLSIDGKADPIRWVASQPKPGKREQRPLGIPTMRDRAKQALVKMALEPEWEAKFEPNSYGFRPGRGSPDAIEAIFKSISRTPNGKFILDADISKCFDRIGHAKLLNKLDNSDAIRKQIQAWLEADILTMGVKEETHEKITPQGGVISPLLANIALHGLERDLKAWIREQRVLNPRGHALPVKDKEKSLSIIRYADDFLIMHKDLHVIEKAKVRVTNWLKENADLELNQAKTCIRHTDEPYNGQKEGCEFLGFQIRRLKVGQYDVNKLRTGTKTIIQPSMESMKSHLQEIKQILKYTNQGKVVIAKLNPIIRGWCNYFKTGTSTVAFVRMRKLLYQNLYNWARRKHPTRGKKYLYEKYFQKVKNQIVFGQLIEKNGKKEFISIPYHNSYPIKRHVKVAGSRSPYDGQVTYWSRRLSQNHGANKRVAKLFTRQEGRCKYCGSGFGFEDIMEVDHIVPISEGGKDILSNLQLLHGHCHDQKR